MKKLRFRLTYANVMSTIACFGVLAGGTAYAANTVGSEDIIDESIVSADIQNYGVKRSDIGLNSINSARVEDFSLNDEDIGAGTFVNFVADIGTVPAHACVLKIISGVGGQGDHLLLTPSVADTSTGIVYGIRYSPAVGHAWLQACNISSASVSDGDTHFNLLVIDAQ